MLALLDAWFIAPFDYGFMRRAVVGGLALSLAAPPLGVFLVLRGMSLIGDAMAHACPAWRWAFCWQAFRCR